MAAGTSRRMGYPKQLLPWGDDCLLSSILDELELLKHPISLVLGAHSSLIFNEIDLKKYHVVLNEDWHTGMASSLRAGISSLDEQVEAVLVTLGDLPFVTASDYAHMLQSWHRGTNILATSYGSKVGVPAIFGRTHFKALSKLEGECGARDYLAKQKDLQIVSLPNAHLDIDSPLDYKRLVELSHAKT